MADDDEIVVSLPPEFDIDDGATVVKVAETKKVAEPADDPIADLKGQFATLQSSHQQVAQRATQAEQRATQAEQQLAESRKDVVASQLDTVTSGLEAAESEAKAAEQAYTVAFEAGDGAAMARAQRSIAKAEARIGRLQEAQEDLKDQTTTTKAPVREQPRAVLADPVEAFLAERPMSNVSAAWIRSHPECVTNPKQYARMIAAHNLCMADEVGVDTSEYFERIEAGIKPAAAKREAVKDDTTTTTTQRRPSAPVAPVNGSGGNAGGGTTVTLTKGEVEAANDGTHVYTYTDPKGKFKKGDVIGTQEFARRKAIMMKQGLYDRTLTT